MATDPHEHTIDPKAYLASDELPGGEHEHHVHVTPFWTMFWVFVILLILTALTVWTSNMKYITIGNTEIEFSATMHILVAMGIAIVKAVLVAGYFMHLIYDKKVNMIVVGSTIFALVLFLGLTLMDMGVRDVGTKDEFGEIFPGGNMSMYKNKELVRDGVEAYVGNIVDATREEAIAASAHEGADHSGEDHPEDAPADGDAPGEEQH